MSTTLVIAAHPDDEVLGCGATIARLVAEGASVVIAILCEGITSRFETREEVAKRELDDLRKKAVKASKILGVTDTQFFGLPDNRFDSIPLLDVVKIVEGLIRNYSPARVLTHSSKDLNIDHTVINRAVTTAVRPMKDGCVRELLAFEIQSSTEWAFGQYGAFSPTSFIDVTKTINKKIKAMSVYEGETRRFPHPRSPEAIKALAEVRGSAVGVEFAEAFEPVFLIS